MVGPMVKRIGKAREKTKIGMSGEVFTLDFSRAAAIGPPAEGKDLPT